MDEFEFEHGELTGSLISMEFGQGGRIQQLWVAESATPEGTQEFQFVSPALDMGEEVTEDYFPGTILLGARMAPEDPWIVGKNATATRSDNSEIGPTQVTFEYQFAFLDEISATGKFYEIPGPIPQIAWDLEIRNRARKSIEIGELAFPLALNNVYEGFPRTEDGTRDMFHDRVYVHKFIGGAASYIYCQRQNGKPPGLLIFPGEDTTWEFYNHAVASLTTPLRWEGIPIVYVHSRATMEREKWPEWFGPHTSVVLEPGDRRSYHMRFAPTERFQADPVLTTFALLGKPVFGLFPGAVAPTDVGITVEVAGATPTRFYTDVEAHLDTESDENGGACTVKPSGPGQVKVYIEDTAGRESELNLLFTRPIEQLIQRRARWIVKNQVVRTPGSIQHAIVAGNSVDARPVTEADVFLTPFGIESGLADALFLAEKNTLYPASRELTVLQDYLFKFLERKVVNPGDSSIGSLLPNASAVAVNTGRPENYALVYCLYDSMARIADIYGIEGRTGAELRARRDAIQEAAFKFCALQEGNGVPLFSYLRTPSGARTSRMNNVSSREYPFNGESLWTANGFEEAFWTAHEMGNLKEMERVSRCAAAARSLSPCWWWYGSDKRWHEIPAAVPHPAMEDKGEMCFGPSTVANSLIHLRSLDRDSDRLDTYRLRLAFGGLLGVWSLVREDGAASLGFCPDSASKQFGMSWTTGDLGIGLYHYLRGVRSLAIASRDEGLQVFGCNFKVLESGATERFAMKPWDGVGRWLVVRHLGLEVTSDAARIRSFEFDASKRHATLQLENTSDKTLRSTVTVSGMWGRRFNVNGERLEVQEPTLSTIIEIAAGKTSALNIEVIG